MRDVAAARDRLGAWCGWVLTVGLALTPLLAWLGPRGFAVYAGFLGLLTAPAIRIRDKDRPLAVVLLLGLAWAAASAAWSAYHPSKPSANTALELAVQLPLYWALVCAARRAEPRLKRRAGAVLAWGAAALGALLFAEVALDAAMYERLNFAFYKPVRHDLAEVAIGHTSSILALLWPVSLAAGIRARVTPWIVVPMLAGMLLAAHRFQMDAPVLSAALVAAVGLAIWRWPLWAPKALAAAAVVYVLTAPVVILAARATGRYVDIQQAIPPSWAARMVYWSHAVDWIGDHPLRGWGLEASRMFGPGIVLHPHDGALQIWLELGAAGAILAATFWWLALSRLSRREPNLAVIGVACSASVYLLFGALSFGVWQGWWLGLGALVAAAAALLQVPGSEQPSS
jgi:O-antigen ligase